MSEKEIEKISFAGKVKKFFNDVYIEMQKVAWPSKDELVGSTTVVIIMSLIMAIFIGAVDRILKLIVGTLIKLAGS
jgi:preprotein translocase subunit SecE